MAFLQIASIAAGIEGSIDRGARTSPRWTRRIVSPRSLDATGGRPVSKA